jgi:hypothetical protein
MLEKITLTKRCKEYNNARRNFHDHRGTLFGQVEPRYRTGVTLSKDSKKYPKIYDEIVRLGKLLSPIDFTTIQLNKDLMCAPHRDGQNVGLSFLISFGTYEGGLIVIDDVEHDAKYNGILFDGSKLLHYNTPHTGTKYSLVFFSYK